MDGLTNISANGQLFNKVIASDTTRQQTRAQDVPEKVIHEEPIAHQDSILDIQRQLAALAPQLNQRLEFSFQKALGQVIVKIIDRQTDTVIKELPPTEFQRVHIALREAIGLLIDKKV